MKEFHLHSSELKKILDFVETTNPDGTLCLGAGRVKITVDNSSGIGQLVWATTDAKIGEQWGEFKICITNESSW